MKMQKIGINELKMAEYNPRKNLTEKDPEYIKIKNSISEFGYISPIIVNSDMTVISGHQRLKVLKELGFTELECIVVDLDKTNEKALNIALNKIQGDWDEEKLEDLLQELKLQNFDTNLTGFDFDEVDEMLKDMNGSKEDDFDIDSAYEEIEEPITKLGDVWILGNHLFYGNRSNFDIWDIERTKKNELHPTMKPVDLIVEAIKNSSKVEDIILDLFGGSGTTLIAAEQMNRICYMMELDPKYCDVIVKRWETLTNKEAILDKR